MQKKWSYKNYEVKEGLKPGSKKFQYFFVVSEGEEKKSRYCVWIEDEVLPRFDPSKAFDTIVSSNRKEWSQWVKEKLDHGDFRNLVRKFDESGEKEFDLDESDENFSMD